MGGEYQVHPLSPEGGYERGDAVQHTAVSPSRHRQNHKKCHRQPVDTEIIDGPADQPPPTVSSWRGRVDIPHGTRRHLN